MAAGADDRDNLVSQLQQQRADLDARQDEILRLQHELTAARANLPIADTSSARRARNRAVRAVRGIELPSWAKR